MSRIMQTYAYTFKTHPEHYNTLPLVVTIKNVNTKTDISHKTSLPGQCTRCPEHCGSGNKPVVLPDTEGDVGHESAAPNKQGLPTISELVWDDTGQMCFTTIDVQGEELGVAFQDPELTQSCRMVDINLVM